MLLLDVLLGIGILRRAWCALLLLSFSLFSRLLPANVTRFGFCQNHGSEIFFGFDVNAQFSLG